MGSQAQKTRNVQKECGVWVWVWIFSSNTTTLTSTPTPYNMYCIMSHLWSLHNTIRNRLCRTNDDNKDFIKDYGERKMNNRLLTKLQSAFKHKHIYSRDAIDFYIGKFFAMKSCNNKNFKYDKYYEQLKKLDSQLFALLDNFWEDLLTFDINDAGDSYDEILNFFINDITNWMRNKTIQ